ncbi:MAG TPA: TfoX/Sxy family protein [Spirochaetia bacterium]|nr:TfoX/Sxy family protein [Spirochaetia bacterium]
MKWVKAPEELKVTIEKLMQGIECEKRPMFGYPAFFINKNMFAGLFQDKVFLRLSPDQVTSLRRVDPSLSALEPMPGRPMKDYFVIAESLYRDESRFRKIAAEAADYARTLPSGTKRAKAKSSAHKAAKKTSARKHTRGA